MNNGLLCLERDWPDDFGNVYVPFKILCAQDFENLIVRWFYHDFNYQSRYYFLWETLDQDL